MVRSGELEKVNCDTAFGIIKDPRIEDICRSAITHVLQSLSSSICVIGAPTGVFDTLDSMIY